MVRSGTNSFRIGMKHYSRAEMPGLKLCQNAFQMIPDIHLFGPETKMLDVLLPACKGTRV